jgi:hypothetical protein
MIESPPIIFDEYESSQATAARRITMGRTLALRRCAGHLNQEPRV